MWISCTREEGVGAAHAQVAGGGQVERAADAAALDGADHREARFVERVEAAHQLAQRVLEGEPRARVPVSSIGMPPAKTSSAMPALKCLPVDEITSTRVSPFGVERLHGVAQRREEGRRHRVQPLGAVQLQVGDAGVGEFEAEEVGSGMARQHSGAPWWNAPPWTTLTRRPTDCSLHLQRWPAAGNARGTVLIVHGLGEHIGRYGAVAAQLNAAGWHVVGYDHRGHGRSEGPRGAIADSRRAAAPTWRAVIDRLRDARRLACCSATAWAG